MAQAGYTPILTYASGTASNVPSAGNLTTGASGAELALNYTDGKLFYKDNAGVVQTIASKASVIGTLTNHALVVGAGAGNPPTTLGSLGTTTTVLHGNPSGAPTFGAVSLTADVSGILPPTNGGTGVNNNASATVTSSGNFAYTRTLTAATNVTFPTTGTLATLAGSETFTNKTLTNPTITNYTETLQAIGTVGASSTLALTNGTVLTATLTASTPCTFTMPTATAGKSFILILTQAATGMTTATFTGVKWPAGTAPTITATASAVDILSFVSNGSFWYGSAAQAFA
jgi:hypothetical protein